jgi:hypothetical protein
MSSLLVVGHRLTPHGLHHRPLTARLSVIMICLPHIRVREKRVYDTDVIFRWLRCRNLSAPSGSGRSFRWMPQPGAGIGWSRDGVRSCRIEGITVGGRGNVRVSDARLVEGRWVGLGFAARSPAGSPRTAAVVRGGRGELGEELGVGVGLAEAVEEHVDGLLAVPAVEGPAQGAGGCHFFGGQQ